jgi:cell wall-associated NlpC family hydrolase
MIRRALACAALALVLAAPASAATSWAQPQIKVVTARGLMGGKAAGFRPDDALTTGELGDLVAGLTGRQQAPMANPTVPVTIAQLDAQLVRGLGLLPAARQFTASIRAAGLVPTRAFGTETVARLLGLRTNHPAAHDDLELLPTDPATRAEAAYSVAHILRFKGWETQFVEDAAAAFELPQLSAWQTRVLNTAVRFVGFPYVWGGTSEKVETPFGVQAHGGFDCSGFVWRVYKLQAYPGGAALTSTIKGRTTYQMSGEVAPAKRIGFAKLAPGDVLFFGPSGPRSKPASIGHTGIYLGGGWMIHSSGQGVAVTPLTGWYRQQFAWGRRPLAEAGLIATR